MYPPILEINPLFLEEISTKFCQIGEKVLGELCKKNLIDIHFIPYIYYFYSNFLGLGSFKMHCNPFEEGSDQDL
jgi:hypothetical protein